MKKDLQNAVIAGVSIAFGITLAACVRGKQVSMQKAGVSFWGAFFTDLILSSFDKRRQRHTKPKGKR